MAKDFVTAFILVFLPIGRLAACVGTVDRCTDAAREGFIADDARFDCLGGWRLFPRYIPSVNFAVPGAVFGFMPQLSVGEGLTADYAAGAFVADGNRRCFGISCVGLVGESHYDRLAFYVLLAFVACIKWHCLVLSGVVRQTWQSEVDD